MTNSKPISLEQLFRYYKELPHQTAAIQELAADLAANGYDVAMRRDRGWFATWSQSGLTRRREAEGQLWAGEQSAAPEPAKIRPESSFSTRLTPHITLGEFALGIEARRFEHQYQVDMAAELAAFLERVRVKFGGKPIIITSGYRPPGINREVGGASQSEHLFNKVGVGAVDFYLQGADIWAVQAYCEENWPHSVGRAASRGFIHLGRRDGGLWVRWNY